MSARTVGSYELEGLLGEGGIGQVYAAQDRVLGRRVAIKTLRPELSRDRNFVERFYVEAKSLGNLNHPNITTIYALQAEGEEAFMVMELVRGHTLEELLARVQRLCLRDALAVVAQAAAGIAYAHRMGVIHRDLKPANLMVTDDGLVKIMDFGIARVRGAQHLTRVGEFCGTFVYAPPEQIRGEEVDERSDLYSLAIVFYRLVAGHPPFVSDNEYQLMTAQLQEPPPPLEGRVPDLDARTEGVLMRALAKRPEDRYRSVDEFARAIGATALRGEAVDILQQLCAHAFSGGDPEKTRIIERSQPHPVPDPTLPSNRMSWRLPEMASPPSVPAQLPDGIAHAASAPRPAAPGTQPRRQVRPWLLGVALGVALLLAGGYLLFTNGPTPAPRPPQVALAEPPSPVKAEPEAASLPVAEPEPPLPPVVKTEPAPVPPPVAKTEPAPAPSPVAKTEPAPAPPPVAETEPAPPPVAKTEPAPAPPPVAKTEPAPAPPPVAKTEPAPVRPPVAKTEPEPVPPSVAKTEPEPVPPPVAKTVPESLPVAKTEAPQVATAEPPVTKFEPAPAAEGPEGKPDLEGRVTGARGFNEIELDKTRWLRLYGLVDRAPQGPRHVEALLRYLRPSHNHLQCYRQAGNTYRCYSAGRDIARLALQDRLFGLGLAANAPPGYRALLAPRR